MIAVHVLFILKPRCVSVLGLAIYPQFIDSMAVLAAAEAAQLGIDVYKPNPLDPYHRAHSYPSVWLVMGALGLTREHNYWFAVAGVGVALTALAVMLRPRTPSQAFEAWLAAASPCMVFAAYRANNDLWVLAVVACIVPCVMSQSRVVRLATPFLIAFAAALKYYPVVASILLLAGPNSREQRARFALLILLLLLVAVGVVNDVAHLPATQPSVAPFWSFGAVMALDQFGVPRAWLVGLLIAAALFAVGCRMNVGTGRGVGQWRDRALLNFVLGAALLTACFWAGVNWGYRWIFVACLLPWFWTNPCHDGDRPSRVVWSIVRYGWWIPMCLTPLYSGIARVASTSGSWTIYAWWFSQGVEWIWFGSLSIVVASLLWHRVLLLRNVTGDPQKAA